MPTSSPLALTTPTTGPRFNLSALPWIIGASVAVLLAAGFIGWLWQMKGRSALAASTGSVTADPDPPVVAPPAKELVKPTADESAGRVSLDNTLETLLKTATITPNFESPTVGNSRVQRWEIRFPAGNTTESYARQLDGLGIELGVIGGSAKIEYASGFTKDKLQRREGSPSDEQRFYMTWRSGALRDLDNALLARARIPTTGRIVAQFYPPQLEKRLADLEKQFADKHDIAEVRHTIFSLSLTDDGYEFRVVEQEYVSGELKSAANSQ
ncbi:MAG TPA: hypothetical protein VGY55_03715 [Pirellulales bacterium]|nr:hypothetical protein [Pirellulales bacterium]